MPDYPTANKTPLIDRLRDLGIQACDLAVDEINRLRDQVTQHKILNELNNAEIERLRDENATLKRLFSESREWNWIDAEEMDPAEVSVVLPHMHKLSKEIDAALDNEDNANTHKHDGE